MGGNIILPVFWVTGVASKVHDFFNTVNFYLFALLALPFEDSFFAIFSLLGLPNMLVKPLFWEKYCIFIS